MRELVEQYVRGGRLDPPDDPPGFDLPEDGEELVSEHQLPAYVVETYGHLEDEVIHQAEPPQDAAEPVDNSGPEEQQGATSPDSTPT